jgi:hypothetical protein
MKSKIPKTAFHVPSGHPETMKRDPGFVGAASSREELFGTVVHVPLGHPETMKRDPGFVGAASSREELFETAFHIPLGHPETMKRDRGFVGAASSCDELFETVITICFATAVMFFALSASAQPPPTQPPTGGNPMLTPTISAEQAVDAVKAALPKVAVGKYWVWTGPGGDTKAKVALTLDGNIVSRIELNPATGEILAIGQDTFGNQVSTEQKHAVNTVQQAIPALLVAAARLGRDGE